ncbi:dTMP kinase [Escherichia coli]|uniref:dTMP kinase n=3 Tax=Escherichia coli TaxID=562 RepID=UPI0009320482|nr:dTMP kinase [Escherichia coli]
MNQRNMSIINSTPVRVIAIVGCDGSGKSTLTASLVNELASRMPTEHIYLGQSSGRIGEWISQLPVIGAPFGRYLRSKAAHVHEKPSTPPGNITALVIYLLSCWRAYKFRKMLCKNQQGYLLITDRYPQDQIPGAYDGTVFPPNVEGGRFVSWLASQERKAFHWMASHKPDLVIKLNVDLEVACARKPDHKRESLARKIAITPQLTFGGAQLVDIDANQPLEKVLVDAEKAITDFMTARGYH